jgi:hypothetical protein
MPLNEVNLGAIKERPEAARLTPSPGLTDILEGSKERLMIHFTPFNSCAFRHVGLRLGAR